MKRTCAFIFSAMLSLAGCGSSSSGPTHTSGTIYDTNTPNVVSTLAGTAGSADTINGVGAAARFGRPDGLAVSPDGTTLYIADFGRNNIRKMDIASQTVSTVAGSTAGVAGFTDDTGTNARFNGPHNLVTDGTKLYVTENGNNAVRQIDIATGAVTTLAGSSSGTAGSADGTGTAATFNGPSGITISPDHSTLYVTDFYNNSIRIIDIATKKVTTMATTSAVGYPAGIIIDETGGNLYVTEFVKRRILKVEIATGAVTVLAGSTSFWGSADGVIGTAASFLTPNGITRIGGSLYVTDPANDQVRRIVLATGAVTTVAGSAAVSGFADGPGATATFNAAIGITTDGTSLFIGDSGNSTVRVIQ